MSRGECRGEHRSCGPTRALSRLLPGLGPSVHHLLSYSSPRNVKQVSNLRYTPSLRLQAKALQHPNAKTRPINKDTICFVLHSPHFSQLFNHDGTCALLYSDSLKSFSWSALERPWGPFLKHFITPGVSYSGTKNGGTLYKCPPAVESLYRTPATERALWTIMELKF